MFQCPWLSNWNENLMFIGLDINDMTLNSRNQCRGSDVVFNPYNADLILYKSWRLRFILNLKSS